ncbi:MAG TPA: 4'-phosphopantetheinyl transferase superfamily protein [Solirubrobacteraceae bacterium]|nr:4'-phosphopantetheinyl transferase superfamily protein [Solirubrobacteraceae bacterium]
MDAPGWLSRQQADVPPGDWWLGANERRVLAGLRFIHRRADWRLGRWTAKAALAHRLGVPVTRIEVLAAPDGAPEAWVDGAPAPVAISVSHRAGRGLAVIDANPGSVGCDLELVEPRSSAFVREWLAASERRLLDDCDPSRRAALANLIWTAKEAAAKVRREGLRLDVRGAVVSAPNGWAMSRWRPLRVDWSDGAGITLGWWRAEPGWVMAIAGEPAPKPPYAIVNA